MGGGGERTITNTLAAERIDERKWKKDTDPFTLLLAHDVRREQAVQNVTTPKKRAINVSVFRLKQAGTTTKPSKQRDTNA